MKTMILSAAALAAVALSAMAAEKPAAGGKCFAVADVKGHAIPDGHTLYMDVGGKSVWRADMSNNCLGGVGATDPLKINATDAGSGKVCEPADLDVRAELGGGGLPSRCRVDALTRLTPAQASALPKGSRP